MTKLDKTAVAQAFDELVRMASNHAGGSSGELAAWQLLQALTDKPCEKFIDAYARVDGPLKQAFLTILAAIGNGVIGANDTEWYVSEARARLRAKG